MAQLPWNDHEQALYKEASELEQRARDLRLTANESRRLREVQQPLDDRLVYAASTYCICGNGMAYDPTGEVRSDRDSPFVMPAQWECSAILKGTADKSLKHSHPMPFAFYEVKSENQPSAHGATTRTPVPPHKDAIS